MDIGISIVIGISKTDTGIGIGIVWFTKLIASKILKNKGKWEKNYYVCNEELTARHLL